MRSRRATGLTRNARGLGDTWSTHSFASIVAGHVARDWSRLSAVGKMLELLTPEERKGSIGLAGLMIIGMLLETLGVGLVVPAIALMLKPDLGQAYPQLQPTLAFLGNPTQRELIIGGMLALVAIYMIKSLFLGWLTWRQSKFAFDITASLSQRLYAVYLHQPYTFHLQRNSAQLIRNVISEVSQFTFSGVQPGLSLVAECLVIVGVTALLLTVEPAGAIIVGAVLGTAMWGFNRLTSERITRWGVVRQLHDGLRMQQLQQGLGGVKDVILLGREENFLNQYATHNAQSARVGNLQATLQQLPRLWLEFLAAAGLAVLVLTMVVQGKAVVTIVPTLGLFAAAAFRLMPSVSRVVGAIASLQYGLAVIDTLHAELQLGSERSPRGAQPEKAFRANVHLSGVSYTYANTPRPALDDLTLTITKGEAVGFIGPSGSGKSTLVDVILGLLAPTSGEVQIDGQDVQGHLRSWQDEIGYVPQAIYLTDDTLRRNVAFGLPDDRIDPVAVARALAAAQLDDFVASLPLGAETVVGERGVRLSGGQRQRIGIARALYHDPAVLVLDEATSALDTATERGVMQAVAALHGTRTILIVAHRLSTVADCDRLYVLDQGRVVAEGTPGEIIEGGALRIRSTA